MAKVIEISNLNEKFYQTWEARQPNRFLVHIKHSKSKDYVVPSYLVKYIDRPSYSLINGKKTWRPIRVEVYEAISERAGVLFDLLRANIFDVTVQELGPVGDVVENWVLPKCKFYSIDPQPLSWSASHDPLTLSAELDWTHIIVKDGDSEIIIEK